MHDRLFIQLFVLGVVSIASMAQTAAAEPPRQAAATDAAGAPAATVAIEAVIKPMRLRGKWYCEVTLLNATERAVELSRSPRWLTVTEVEADGGPKEVDGEEDTIVTGATRMFREERKSRLVLWPGEGFVKRVEMEGLLGRGGGRHRVEVEWEVGAEFVKLPATTFIADGAQ